MNPAKPNNYGITNAGYATSMTDGGALRTQLQKQGITYQETPLAMGTLVGHGPACIITYTNPSHHRQVSVLIIPVGGIPDDWCEEYYTMLGADHEAALSRNWPDIVDEVRKLYQPWVVTAGPDKLI